MDNMGYLDKRVSKGDKAICEVSVVHDFLDGVNIPQGTLINRVVHLNKLRDAAVMDKKSIDDKTGAEK